MDRLLVLRKHALDNFSEANIPVGTPLSELESVFVPVYLMHRYQVEAVAKMIGGYHYEYAVRGKENTPRIKPVSPEEQREATTALLNTLDLSVLGFNGKIMGLIPPPAMGYSRNRELFNTQNGGGFDPLAMAQSAADNTFTFLLHPHRMARIAEQSSIYLDGTFSSTEQYLRQIHQFVHQNVLKTKDQSFALEISMMVEKRLIAHLIQLAANKSISERVRAAALTELHRIKNTINVTGNFTSLTNSHQYYVDQTIKQFLADPRSVEISPAPKLPDGSPIGCGGFH
jgi:hypothetical protein